MHTHQTLPWANHDIIGADVITNPPCDIAIVATGLDRKSIFLGLVFSSRRFHLVFSLRRLDMCDRWADW